jgi:hypothetical protein
MKNMESSTEEFPKKKALMIAPRSYSCERRAIAAISIQHSEDLWHCF